MTNPTPLDAARTAMLADPEDDLARLRYYRVLADTELCLLLADEASDTTLAPRVFELDDGPVVLAFDTEDRLADFSNLPVPYAVLPGRVVVARLAGQGIGLGINLGDAASAWLMAPHAVDWLADLLATAPTPARGRPVAIHAPGPLDPRLAEAVAVALSGAGGLAAGAVLARAAWADGTQGLLLAWLGARAETESALARALTEALAFSGAEGSSIDMVFLAPEDPAAQQLVALGQPLDLPPPPAPSAPPTAPSAPGMDPARPPRLR